MAAIEMRFTALRILLLCALCLISATPVRADSASGTWSGDVEGRGNYYWERSTRVLLPAVRAKLVAPNDLRIAAHYAIDVISSASISQTGGARDAVFTELRHAGGLQLGKTFSAGDNEFDLALHGTYSGENDYQSWLYGVRGSFSWNERNSTLFLGLNRLDDLVLSNTDPSFKGRLDGMTGSLGLTQLLSSAAILTVSYQLIYLDGYLGNPYRRVLRGPLPFPESPPDHRLRHSAEGHLAYYLPATSTTLQGQLRLYTDSWKLTAVTPELRVYQQLGASLNLRLRYRLYTQSGASFALPTGQRAYPRGTPAPYTNDAKLEKFHSHQVGLRAELALEFLGATFLEFARRGFLDISFDYQVSTSRFGNNVIGTLGAQLPF